ncbi:MAG: hypothetical protein K2X77_16330 [Candidatus Obscuribacterales bacterium]|jgi:hypothetical protein|nr:hypothetical protein [Candidatus Obscuribacterales bacterium]
MHSFDNEKTFPKAENISSVFMLDDGSLKINILRNDSDLHYHGYILCPANTKMHSWILQLSGPLTPGKFKLFVGDAHSETASDDPTRDSTTPFF